MAGITKITKNSIQGIDTSADATAITIDSSENVGIGTTSPSTALDVTGTSRYTFNVANAYTLQTSLNAAGSSFADDYKNASQHIWQTSGSERMRIDSSGNLLVGTTSNNKDITGASLRQAGDGYFTRNDTLLYLNRLSSNGELLRFSKDGTQVGNILNDGLDTITVGSYDVALAFQSGADAISPWNNSTNSIRDNAIDLGRTISRFDDIYATNGTIQTSDQNEKQQIQSLNATEMAVAKRISKLFKTFKWNSAVEEKGDSARTHTGIIAQDVQQAFADEGLDASNYALFISSTWWEKEISVDAVAEELDEEGNVVVEGKDAYTYMDTKEEATEGYTERTRLGIRYPELLSFVSSAFEQRLTNIETRLTALET